MFKWQSDDVNERLLQLRQLCLQVHFRVIIDNFVKLYGIDKKNKQIMINENLLNIANFSAVEKLLKEIGGKKLTNNDYEK